MKGLRMDGTAIKVMAVDDSPITRKMIKKALERRDLQLSVKRPMVKTRWNCIMKLSRMSLLWM